MFEEFISELGKARGRYPVSNLIADFLKGRPAGSAPFKLGHWLQSLDQPTLEDVQTKLDMLLGDIGPDHAGEDLIVAVDLLSSAEHGEPMELSDKQIKLRLLLWFEAGLMEKLSRAGAVRLTGPMSINPDIPCPVELQVAAAEYLLKQQATLTGARR